MEKMLNGRLVASVVILAVVCFGSVFAGDVIVKEGNLTAAKGTFTDDLDANENVAMGCSCLCCFGCDFMSRCPKRSQIWA